MDIFFFKRRNYIVNLITISGEHIETLDSCFDLIRSHQQCISWSPPLEIEPTTAEYKAETLPLGHQPTPHANDAKSW